MTTFIQSGLKITCSWSLKITKMRKPSQDISIGYIIDLYNKFARNENVVSIFKIHGQEYCIRAITEFEWGKPVFDKSIDDDFDSYCVYDTIEEAKGYIRYLKQLDGSRM